MAREFNAKINPACLKWAREEAGYPNADAFVEDFYARRKYKKTKEEFRKAYHYWEKQGGIPIVKLKHIAEMLKRQVSMFFLPEAPPKMHIPKDFRSHAENESLSTEMYKWIRRTNYLQNTARKVLINKDWDVEYRWIQEIKGKPLQERPEKIREYLDIPFEKQCSWKNTNTAYNNWRKVLEKRLGILIFQFPIKDDLDGFCYIKKKPYVIVVNSKQAARRIFTLFHELGHILDGDSGLCLPLYQEHIKKEANCNSFAAKFLIPQNELKSVNTLEKIEEAAKKAKVSTTAYLVRLYKEDLINQRDYLSWLRIINNPRKDSSSERGFTLVNPRTRSGDTLYEGVLDAVAEERMDYPEACDVLGIGLKTLFDELS